MTLKELLQESYYDGLYHLSDEENLNINNMKNINAVQNFLPDKPAGGLWLAKGLSWLRWGAEEGFFSNLEHLHLYRVKINPKAKIMDLRETSTDIFLEPKGRKNQRFKKKKNGLRTIDFIEIAKEYDGVRVYNVEFTTYNVPSVVIFNKGVIQNIEYVDKAINIIRKI